MNEYNVSDYGIFTNSINTTKVLNSKFEEMKTSSTNCKSTLSNQAVFMGPACDSCLQALASADSKLVTLTDNFSTIISYLAETSANYQAGDQAASNVLMLENGKVGVGAASAVGAASTGAALSNLPGNTHQEKIYNYFASQGYNHAAICGILSNIKHESGYRTDALGDGGTSYGICQWHNERWQRLDNYCLSNNLDPKSLDGQLAYLSYEFSQYPNLVNTFKSVPNTADGAYQAAYAMTVQFERPANSDAAGQTRGYAAQKLMEEMNAIAGV